MREKIFAVLFGIIIVVAAMLYFLPKKSVAPTTSDGVSKNTNQPFDSMPQSNTNQDSGKTNVNALSTSGGADITTADVNYYQSVNGYLARPKAEGVYPGVVMIHEWWGLNDGIKAMARELAGQGYIVLAVDLYNGSVGTTADEATKLVQGVDQAQALDNMRAAVNYLRAKEKASRLATLGWCFGGGQSLQYALSGDQVDATVLYYGTPLVTDKQRLVAINWPVLGIFGDQDQAIPVDSVRQFEKTLGDLGVQNEVYVYPGVGHAFANPSGQNYAPKETKDAWEKTLAFLAKNLK